MKVGEIWEVKDKKQVDIKGDKVKIRYLTSDKLNGDLVAYTYIESSQQSGLKQKDFIHYFRRVYNA